MFKSKKIFSWLCLLSSIVILTIATHPVLSHPGDTTEQIVAQNDQEIDVKAVPVRDNIYMIKGDGGNIGLSVGDEGALMIDSQYASLSDRISQTVAVVNNDKPIRYLINTHYHKDHTDGNINFAKKGITIISHDNVPKQMRVPHEYKILGMTTEAVETEALPKITFSDNTRFALNDNYIHAFHIPLAHTDGDIVVHFTKKNVIHTGDLFFNGFYPFIDTTVGGSLDGMIQAIDRILPLCNKDTLIIPGHGPLGDKDELMAFQDMLKTVSTRLKVGIQANQSAEDMLQEGLFNDLDEVWSKGFLSTEKFIKIAYQGAVKS